MDIRKKLKEENRYAIEDFQFDIDTLNQIDSIPIALKRAIELEEESNPIQEEITVEKTAEAKDEDVQIEMDAEDISV